MVFDLADEPADVLAGVARHLDHLALSHALPYGVGHGNGQGGAGVLDTLLSSGFDAHGLPQCSNGLLGGGHVDMFAHRGGHMEAHPYSTVLALACGHIDVASWMCVRDP